MSLDLKKQQVLDLKKKKGIDGQLAQVVFCVDYSGSMDWLYENGFVQRVLERLFPVAMAFDDNQNMDFILFQNDFHVCPSVTVQNLQNYVNKIALKQGYDMGGTSYAPALREVILPQVMETLTKESGGFLGFGKTKEVEVTGKAKLLDYPIYVIFLTDGECGDRSDTYEVVRQLSHGGAFIQFIGIGGSSGFHTLQKLDDLSGRMLDNADFFAIDDLDQISDEVLYDRLMTEFPEWIPQAKAKGLIK